MMMMMMTTMVVMVVVAVKMARPHNDDRRRDNRRAGAPIRPPERGGNMVWPAGDAVHLLGHAHRVGCGIDGRSIGRGGHAGRGAGKADAGDRQHRKDSRTHP
jgi:hypothetical protein